jgi:hypothetical protein
MEIPKSFRTEWKFDTLTVCVLWQKDGSETLSVVIRKTPVYKADGVSRDLVFDVYKYIEQSRVIPYSGDVKSLGNYFAFRTVLNEDKGPLTDFDEALLIAREAKVRAGSEWVVLEKVRPGSKIEKLELRGP